MCCLTNTQSFGPFEVALIPPKAMKMKTQSKNINIKLTYATNFFACEKGWHPFQI
jgi:hypothetical protein